MDLKFINFISVSCLFLVLAPASALGVEKEDFIKQFATELLLNSSDEAERDFQSQDKLLKPIPLAEPKGAIPPDCHPHEFQRLAAAHYQNAFQYGQDVKRYFNRCTAFLRQGQTKGLLGLLKFAMTEYDLSRNPLIKHQSVKLSDGSLIDSYIGVKDHWVKRPWVLVKCGVFCDISSSDSSLNFLINLFDQSPFNVIFLSNHTGNLHIKTNHHLMVGGFYEAYDFYDIANWLKFESPYKDTVDSIHVLGISLGGSAAMAVSHWNELYESRDGRPLFNSTMAICPVVNLGPTLKDMYAPTNKGRFFTRLSWSALKEAEPYLPEASDYLSRRNPPPSQVFPTMMADISLRYGIPWEESNPPGRRGFQPLNIDELLSLNNFGLLPKDLSIPTLAWASFDDPIVSFSLNTETLIRSSYPQVNQGAVGVDYGGHCGFATAYGYGATTAILQSFILNNSPDFLMKQHSHQIKIAGHKPLMWPMDIHLRQWWIASAKKDYVTLHYETFNAIAGVACRFMDPFKSYSSCRRHYTQKVPLESLKEFSLQVPENDTEAQILSRRLNGSMRVTFNGEPIDGKMVPPTHLKWIDY